MVDSGWCLKIHPRHLLNHRRGPHCHPKTLEVSSLSQKASNEGEHGQVPRFLAEPTTPGVRYDRYVIFPIIKNLLVKLVKVIHVIFC